MAGHHDHNPFDKDDHINPFSNPHNVHAVTPNARLSTLDPEPADFHHHRVTVDNPLDSYGNLKKKRRELEAKEAELNRREEIVRRKEEALAKSGVVIEQKNWPPFFPVVHHDISGEIPVHLQRLQYIAFATLLGVPISLFWNLITSLAIFAAGATGWFIFFAIIYCLLGPPGAYYIWYRPLYNALRCDNGVSFGCFFFNYTFHIVFFVLAAIGPRLFFRGLDFSGILNALKLMPDHPTLGILCFIGFGFFATEAIVSIWLLQKVYRHFCGSSKREDPQGTGALSYAI